jgi:hypothetical protein
MVLQPCGARRAQRAALSAWQGHSCVQVSAWQQAGAQTRRPRRPTQAARPQGAWSQDPCPSPAARGSPPWSCRCPCAAWHKAAPARTTGRAGGGGGVPESLQCLGGPPGACHAWVDPLGPAATHNVLPGLHARRAPLLWRLVGARNAARPQRLLDLHSPAGQRGVDAAAARQPAVTRGAGRHTRISRAPASAPPPPPQQWRASQHAQPQPRPHLGHCPVGLAGHKVTAAPTKEGESAPVLSRRHRGDALEWQLHGGDLLEHLGLHRWARQAVWRHRGGCCWPVGLRGGAGTAAGWQRARGATGDGGIAAWRGGGAPSPPGWRAGSTPPFLLGSPRSCRSPCKQRRGASGFGGCAAARLHDAPGLTRHPSPARRLALPLRPRSAVLLSCSYCVVASLRARVLC